jgi:hypothetical protein
MYTGLPGAGDAAPAARMKGTDAHRGVISDGATRPLTFLRGTLGSLRYWRRY